MKKLFNLFYKSSGICTDTRKISAKCLFIALKGDNFNGNKFALSAIEKGAAYAIVDEEEFANNKNIFLVKDTLYFLQSLAKYHRQKLNTPIIAITGTNGKTTTKELINTVLSVKFKVLATKGNLNNHIGVPLTLLELTNKHDVGVIEMGASKPGDIKELCEITEPNYGIITNIGNAHMEGFKNPNGVFNTKMELFDNINNSGGIFIYNSSDKTFNGIKEKTHKAKLFPFGNNTSICGEIISNSPFLSFNWSTDNKQQNTIHSKVVGAYNLNNFLCAIVYGELFNISPSKICSALSEYSPANNRSQFAATQNNKIIIDCYNANPSSMKAAIDNLNHYNDKNKVLILGDMLELGDISSFEHKEIIKAAKKYKLKLYTVGEIFHSIDSEFITKKFMNVKEGVLYFKKHPIKNSIVLLKGSRAIALENLIKEL